MNNINFFTRLCVYLCNLKRISAKSTKKKYRNIFYEVSHVYDSSSGGYICSFRSFRWKLCLKILMLFFHVP